MWMWGATLPANFFKAKNKGKIKMWGTLTVGWPKISLRGRCEVMRT